MSSFIPLRGIILLVLALSQSVWAAAAEESINLLPTDEELVPRESCPDGGVLRLMGESPYAGLPWHLVETVPEIKAQHDRLTQHEATWVNKLEGPSQFNRLFEHGADRIVVFDNCQPHRCDQFSLYGAIALPSKTYSLALKEAGLIRWLGARTPAVEAAFACARTVDARKRPLAPSGTR